MVIGILGGDFYYISSGVRVQVPIESIVEKHYKDADEEVMLLLRGEDSNTWVTFRHDIITNPVFASYGAMKAWFLANLTLPPIPIDISDLSDDNDLLSKCILATYAELVALRDASELITGMKYEITDFAQAYNIFDGSTMTIIEEKVGNTESLILLATSGSTFDKVAYSPLFPNDIIHYSIDTLDIRDIGFGNGVDTVNANFKGMIYYRKDTVQNVETHYDFRNIKFRRWAVDATGFDNGKAYVAKDVCKSSDGKIYKCITATTGEGDPTVNTADWILWLDITADAFVSWTSDKNYFNIGDINTTNLIINNVTAGVDYDDFYTFGDYYKWVKNVSIGMIDLEYSIEDWSYATQLNNIVFKTTDDYYTCFSNKISSNNFNNTIGNNFNYNTIGNDFNKNIIGNDFYNNTIGNNFNYNTIGNDFYSNTIGNIFNFNTTGDGFNSNTTGDCFNSNTIGNNFNYNTIGNDFNKNIIGNDFYNNTIGNYFNSNTIGNYFGFNTTGYNFNSNTIGDEFNSNTIGNNFNYNTIGNDFYSNTIGNIFNFNTTGDGFNSNTTGDCFNSNTIGNGFNSNTIGNYFNSNTIGNGFKSNTIGNYLYKTIFGDNCQYNTIANNINGTTTNKIITFGNSITMCTIQDYAFGLLAADLNLTAATHIRGAYNTTIYQDATQGVKLSYMTGGVLTIADVTD